MNFYIIIMYFAILLTIYKNRGDCINNRPYSFYKSTCNYAAVNSEGMIEASTK